MSEERPEGDIWTETGVNVRGEPFVQIRWGTEGGQFTPEEARQFALTILSVAESAEMDSCVFRFAVEEMGMERARAATLLDALRKYRQPPPPGKE
jgi:hypothetical protein